MLIWIANNVGCIFEMLCRFILKCRGVGFANLRLGWERAVSLFSVLFNTSSYLKQFPITIKLINISLFSCKFALFKVLIKINTKNVFCTIKQFIFAL